VWVGGHRRSLVRTTKEPALSRRPKHLAPATTPSGSSGTGAHGLSPRNRSRLLLLLALVCAGLLIAAPLAIVLSSGGAEAGGTRNPGGVFQGGPDDGTGRGSGVPGASVTTAASQTPAPAGGDQATGVSPAAEAGGAVGANGGGGGWVPAGGGTVIQPGTAAGAPAPAAAGGQQPGAQQPAGQQPAAQQPAQQPAPQQSASQGAAPQQSASPQTDPNGYPCPCQVINGVLTSLAAPLPKLPSGPLG